MKEVNFTGHIVAAPRKTSRYKKGKASLDLNEARDDGVL